LPKTLVFLNDDERWRNFREYSFDEENYGKKNVTFVFGIIISVICTFIFGLQNVLLGLVLNGRFKMDIISHVLGTTKTQLLLIYDTSLFYKNNNHTTKGFLPYVKMAAGYFLYVLPVGCIGYLFLSIHSTSFICQDMKARFLLDNTFKPVVNMTELYLMRREVCREKSLQYCLMDCESECDKGTCNEEKTRTEYAILNMFVGLYRIAYTYHDY